MSLTTSPVGTKKRYRFAASGYFFIQGLVYASWASRIPDIKAALHLNDAQFGTALLALPAGQLAAMALSGYLVTRFGSRHMVALAAILYPSALINLSLAASFWQFILFGFIFGMCGNLSNISVNTQGVGIERLYAGSIMASFHGLWSVAGFVGGMLSVFMVDWGFTPTQHFCMVLAFAFLLVLATYKSLLPRDKKPPPKAPSESRTTGRIFSNKYILVLGIIGFSSMLCEGAVFNWSGIYFEDIIKTPQDLIRAGFIAFTFGMACGRFSADRFVVKFGVVKVLQASGLTIVAGLLISILWPSLVPATIGFALVGFGTSSIVPLCYSMAGKSVSIPPGIAIASVSSISFFGFMVGPPVIGYIAETANLRYSLALVALAGVLVAVLAPRTRGK